jgi:hypothetical protein
MNETRSLEEIERVTDIYMQLQYLSLESLRNLRVSIDCEMWRKRGRDPFTHKRLRTPTAAAAEPPRAE